MKKSDFQLIGYIGTILGAFFLVGGVFAQMYYEVHRSPIIEFYWTVYPYQKYAGSLLIAGIVLLVIGLTFLWRAKQKEREKAPSNPLYSKNT